MKIFTKNDEKYSQQTLFNGRRSQSKSLIKQYEAQRQSSNWRLSTKLTNPSRATQACNYRIS